VVGIPRGLVGPGWDDGCKAIIKQRNWDNYLSIKNHLAETEKEVKEQPMLSLILKSLEKLYLHRLIHIKRLIDRLLIFG